MLNPLHFFHFHFVFKIETHECLDIWCNSCNDDTSEVCDSLRYENKKVKDLTQRWHRCDQLKNNTNKKVERLLEY